MGKDRTDAWHFTRIEKGHFTSRAVNQIIRSLEGQNVEVLVRKRRSYRTPGANRYYWGVVIHLLGERLRELGITGEHGGPITDSEVHEMMKAKFLRHSICIDFDTGECIDIIRSTTGLTKSEFWDYVESIRSWAVHPDNGIEINIPDPGEQLSFV